MTSQLSLQALLEMEISHRKNPVLVFLKVVTQTKLQIQFPTPGYVHQQIFLMPLAPEKCLCTVGDIPMPSA